jgi:hypothetical protein
VLNLVNTKQDKTVKRGAVVKAMAICTRHPFLHIYKVISASRLIKGAANPRPSPSYYLRWMNTSRRQCLKHWRCYTMP